MNYQDFRTHYQALFDRWMCYTPNQVGSWILAEKLADLADAYPQFETRLEQELEQENYVNQGESDASITGNN